MSINLLPWRETRRQANKKQFFISIATSTLCAFLLVTGVHLLLSQKLSNQQSRNTYLRSEIGAKDRKIREIKNLKQKREELLDRMNIIQGLQGNRPVIVRVLDTFVHLVPEGVYFSHLSMKKQLLSIKGVAENNSSISEFMRNLDQSVWFDQPNLTAVKALDSGEGSLFNLSIEQVMPEAKESQL